MTLSPAPERDTLRRFLFEGAGVRGVWVHLDETWRAALAHVDYPLPVRAALGEGFAAVAMLSATLKTDASLTLQITGAGALRLMVVQARGQRVLRGIAQWRDEALKDASTLFDDDAQLAVTFDPGEGRERYQGLVEVAGSTVGASIERYFERSEQLPNRLWFASDGDAAAGLMLQVMPGASAEDDTWNRLTLLADTLSASELLQCDAATLLCRLFSEEDIRLFDAEPVRFQCDCSRERVDAILRALGADEVGEILEEQGQVEVRCEFCNATYRYDAVDAAALLRNSAAVQAASPTQH